MKIKSKVDYNYEKLRTPLSVLINEVNVFSEGTVEYVKGYINSRIKCWWKCKVCGWVWLATPRCIKQKHKCPECKRNKRIITVDKMKEKLKEVWGSSIIYIDGYTKMSEKCKFKCTVCKYEWEVLPNTLINTTSGCPKCAINKKITPLNSVLEKIKKIHGDSIIYVNGYINTQLKCKWKCSNCKHEWETTPNCILQGTSCPKCSLISMEKPVINILERKGIVYKHNKWLEGSNFNNSIRPLKPDFIIETNKGKLCIETDGKQHFTPIYGEEHLKAQQERDKYKNKFLKEQGYILIRVTSSPTKEWGTKKHITLAELLNLIEIGINSETKEIDFELFKKYDFNRE